MKNEITPFLWFDNNAYEAAEFYVSVFGPRARIVSRDSMAVTFELDGRPFVAFNGGPHFKLNEAFSLFVPCDTQPEIDALWTKLLAGGGSESMCGWLKDRFGLSWQVAPSFLPALLQDPARGQQVSKVMMTMRKLDVAALRAAAG